MDEQPADTTLAFYEANAGDFEARTCGLDMSHLYGPFLARLAPGARVLDAGCGPGRDVREFAGRGLEVEGMDGSKEMARRAHANTGRVVHHLRFQDVAWEGDFDGIWACASLLHVPRGELADVLWRLGRALRPGGVFYASFKHGEEDWEYQGRRFFNHTAATVEGAVRAVPSLRLERTWRTLSANPAKPDEEWLNVLMDKVERHTGRPGGRADS